MRGTTWREGSFTGDPGVCVRENCEDGHLFPKGPRWGKWTVSCKPGTLKDE